MDTFVQNTLAWADHILRETGWTQNRAFSFDEEGNVTGACLVSAISLAAQLMVEGDVDGVVADTQIALHKVLNVSSLVAWNDAPERTLDEVRAALEAAYAVA